MLRTNSINPGIILHGNVLCCINYWTNERIAVAEYVLCIREHTLLYIIKCHDGITCVFMRYNLNSLDISEILEIGFNVLIRRYITIN